MHAPQHTPALASFALVQGALSLFIPAGPLDITQLLFSLFLIGLITRLVNRSRLPTG